MTGQPRPKGRDFSLSREVWRSIPVYRNKRSRVKIKRILAPTDLSPASLEAIEHAVDLARIFDAELILLFVQEAPYFGSEPDPYVVSANFRLLFAEHQRVVREQMAALHTKLGKRGARCRAVLGEGNAAAQILATARKEKADLIVMATHGRTGAKRVLLGSVAEKVVRGAQCPVLTLRLASVARRGRGAK
jgi:nucleotide-binding universal stress UspA family protein